MEKIHLRVSLGILLVCLLWISGSASVPSKYSLGISPQDDSYYKSNVMKCKDGSKKFNRHQLNDEFCDCPDGTDEPGTSACPEGRFYCQNTGHIPLTIFSSRVNDGICDCCDGSDEYYGAVSCPNTCWEAGKVAREKMKKKIQTYQEGVIIRKQEVEKGRQALAKDEADLSKLKTEGKILKELVDKLKEQKEQIEKAEEEERLKKEKEEKRLKEAEMKAEVHEKSSEEVPHDGADGVHEELQQPETSNWTVAPLIRDSFSMIGSAVGGTASAFYGFNHAMPIVRRWVKGPMWLHFLIGAPPVIVFSSAFAGLAGGAVPAMAQLVSSSCHAAVSSSSSLARSAKKDEKLHKTRSSSPLLSEQFVQDNRFH